jgi:hypothetical protein
MAENVEYVVSAKDLASDVFASVEKGLKGIGEQTTELKAKVGSLVSTVGAGIFAHMIDETIRGEAELTTFGQIAGISAVKFSTLTEAAALSRTPLNDVAGIVSKLSQVVGQAKLGDEGKKSLFAALGIDPNDGKDAADRLLQVAKAVTNMADQDVAAYATRQLLNKSFAEARPLLAQLAEQESLTTRATSEGIVAAKQYEDGTRRLSYEAGQAKIVFVNEWLPAINGVVEAMVKAQKEGGTLAAVIAGIQTTITGTDQYKNDKELTRLTELQKQIQDKIDELKRDRRHGDPGCQRRRGPRHAQVLEEAARAGQRATEDHARLQGGAREAGESPAASKKRMAWTTPPSTRSSRARSPRRPCAPGWSSRRTTPQWSPRRRPRAKNSQRPCELNTALAQEAYKQGEIDQVEYIRRQAANEDASLAAKIAALQKEEELAQKKGDKEREQIAKNGIAAAQAERTAQG